MNKPTVAIIGASSLVGDYVLARFIDAGVNVLAFSRQPASQKALAGIQWSGLAENTPPPDIADPLPYWICLCPIHCVAEYFALMERSGARRVVALSSTSRFTKSAAAGAEDGHDIELANRLAQGEQQLQDWAENAGVEWVILRPTLIYDLVRDRNLAQIVMFIQNYRFFPLLGEAKGLRQPVYADDVAAATIAALYAPATRNFAYNISGGETISYRKMVERIFAWLGQKPRFFTVSLVGFKVAVALARALPRYRHLSSTMAQRMNRDLVFDHSQAATDFGYAPSKFLESIQKFANKANYAK